MTSGLCRLTKCEIRFISLWWRWTLPRPSRDKSIQFTVTLIANESSLAATSGRQRRGRCRLWHSNPNARLWVVVSAGAVTSDADAGAAGATASLWATHGTVACRRRDLGLRHTHRRQGAYAKFSEATLRDRKQGRVGFVQGHHRCKRGGCSRRQGVGRRTAGCRGNRRAMDGVWANSSLHILQHLFVIPLNLSHAVPAVRKQRRRRQQLGPRR